MKLLFNDKGQISSLKYPVTEFIENGIVVEVYAVDGKQCTKKEWLKIKLNKLMDPK
jgi:hypothetical protein